MTCREYASVFLQLQTEFPGVKFSWIDIEDNADLVDPVEVDNFPTVLLAVDAQVRFFGAVTPHAHTLRRLIQTHQSNTPSPSDNSDAQLTALAQRLL